MQIIALLFLTVFIFPSRALAVDYYAQYFPKLIFLINTIAIMLLLLWAAVNIIIGYLFYRELKKDIDNAVPSGELLLQTTMNPGAKEAANPKTKWKYFAQMCVFWNFVNGILGIAGLINIFMTNPQAMNDQQIQAYVYQSITIILVNILLDIAYVIVGYLVFRRGRSSVSDQLKGYGLALVFQGTFLLVFDIILFILNNLYA
jgi:uncharacterized membrane protein